MSESHCTEYTETAGTLKVKINIPVWNLLWRRKSWKKVSFKKTSHVITSELDGIKNRYRKSVKNTVKKRGSGKRWDFTEPILSRAGACVNVCVCVCALGPKDVLTPCVGFLHQPLTVKFLQTTICSMLCALTRNDGWFTTVRVEIWEKIRKMDVFFLGLVWSVRRFEAFYDCGRCCLIISLDWGGILSGKRTENSTMRSPRCDGFLGKGRPSPLSRFTVPGLMMSWQGREMMRFSSVGMLTVQPHNAWRGEKEQNGTVSIRSHNEMPKPRIPTWPNASMHRKLWLIFPECVCPYKSKSYFVCLSETTGQIIAEHSTSRGTRGKHKLTVEKSLCHSLCQCCYTLHWELILASAS